MTMFAPCAAAELVIQQLNLLANAQGGELISAQDRRIQFLLFGNYLCKLHLEFNFSRGSCFKLSGWIESPLDSESWTQIIDELDGKEVYLYLYGDKRFQPAIRTRWTANGNFEFNLVEFGPNIFYRFDFQY